MLTFVTFVQGKTSTPLLLHCLCIRWEQRQEHGLRSQGLVVMVDQYQGPIHAYRAAYRYSSIHPFIHPSRYAVCMLSHSVMPDSLRPHGLYIAHPFIQPINYAANQSTTHPSIHLSTRLSIHPSIHPSICPLSQLGSWAGTQHVRTIGFWTKTVK